MNKLINFDKVNPIIGPVCASAAAPSLSIAQNIAAPTIIFASAPHLTLVGIYLRVCPSDLHQARVAAKFMFCRLNPRNVAIVYVNNDSGLQFKETFRTRFLALGGKVLYERGVQE